MSCRRCAPAPACARVPATPPRPLGRVNGHGHVIPIGLRVATSPLFIPLRHHFAAGARHRARFLRTRWDFDVLSYTAVSAAARTREPLPLCSSASTSGVIQAIAGFKISKLISSYLREEEYLERG